MIKWKKGLYPGLLLIWLFAMPLLAAEEAKEPEQLYAQSAVLMDADSGRILFDKNGEEVRPNASTTKILTCILALEEGDLKDEVTFSKKAAQQPQVHLGAGEGKTFYLEDLLYSLMLESHNDTAVAVAEYVAGSTEAFAVLMNEKAEKIGCENTHFVSPNGLDWEDEGGAHSTTAADLAKILRYCIKESPKREAFLAITRTSEKTFSDVDGKGTYSCVNHNAFLSMMDGALTGKTGFTSKAGYCYVGALTDGERTFVIALLACGWPNNKSYKWSDAKAMFRYGLAAYRYEDVARELSFEPVLVENGVTPGQAIGENAVVSLSEKREETVNLLLSNADEVKIAVELPRYLKAPVEEGKQVGEVIYFLNGKSVRKFPIVTLSGAERKDYSWCLWKILEKYLGF